MTGIQAVGSAGPPAPSQGAGELAGLLAEVKELTPKHLRKIEQVAKDFHTAREASEKAQDDAEQEQGKAKLAQQELAQQEHQHTARMGRDLDALNRREVEVKARETNVGVREEGVTVREQTVADAERRIQHVSKNISGIGGTAA